MTDTHTQAPSAAPQSSKVVVVIKAIPRGIQKTLSVVSWVMPLMLMFVGWFFFPQLRDTVTWPWLAPATIWLPMFAIFFAAVVWVYIEIMYAVYRNTTVRQLQADDGISLLQALLITFFVGVYAAHFVVPWWLVIPWIMSMLDAFFSGFLAINNAFQKNPTQLQKGE